MYGFSFQILTENDQIAFKATATSGSAVNQFAYELIMIFASDINNEEMQAKINSDQQNTVELRQKLLPLLHYHAEAHPQLNALIAFINRMRENEYFCFLPQIELSQENTFRIYEYLKAKNLGIPAEDIPQPVLELLGSYHVTSYGHKRVTIGEKDKTLRKCRFCGQGASQVTFNVKAHAISEGLGNKKVVLFDECDECNRIFGRTIEPDLINFLSLLRTTYGVVGKDGIKDVRTKNYHLRYLDKSKDVGIEKGEPLRSSMEVKLELPKICPQNIYRALCKFFISVIPTEELIHFEGTVRWIRGEKAPSALPKVVEILTYKHFTLEPRLLVYLRKSDDKNLPYAIGEFHFTCIVLVFVIPFSKENTVFSTDWWNLMPHYKGIEPQYLDLSLDEAKDFVVKVIFNPEASDANSGNN